MLCIFRPQPTLHAPPAEEEGGLDELRAKTAAKSRAEAAEGGGGAGEGDVQLLEVSEDRPAKRRKKGGKA